MRRIEMFYAVIGGLVGAVLAMAAGLIAPLGAQNDVRDVEFGMITCKEIQVVDTDGAPLVIIDRGEHGGGVFVRNKDGKSGVLLRSSEYGGYVEVVGNKGKSYGYMGTSEHGVGIGCQGKDGTSQAVMSVRDEHSAAVVVSNEDEEPVVHIGSTDYGGVVSVYGKGEKSELEKNFS